MHKYMNALCEEARTTLAVNSQTPFTFSGLIWVWVFGGRMETELPVSLELTYKANLGSQRAPEI